ncbi:hypothetical protein H2248_011286 [Termitomyces sp. 'cryptogamus']|nr:hypothetical protein H2248_011286 [Termitomyces sp. 'cryptogamus']
MHSLRILFVLIASVLTTAIAVNMGTPGPMHDTPGPIQNAPNDLADFDFVLKNTGTLFKDIEELAG